MLESPRRRRLYTLLAIALAGGFLAATHCFWTAANGGPDQNGYLVGGKLLARHGSPAFVPSNPDTGSLDPFLFVGRMWVSAAIGTPSERYYPKYPLGLSVLTALMVKLGTEQAGPILAYWISPVCAAGALLGTFLLLRLILGSFPALLGMLVVGASPVVLLLANNPNSHCTALGLVTWGMYLLLRWWHQQRTWQAVVAGLLLGGAFTIRYTEGLLLLPALLVICYCLRWRPRRSWVQAGALLVCWALPVAAQVVANRIMMGTWTGYDSTHESTGFAWQYFLENWDTTLRQLYGSGLVFLFPLSVAGLVAMLVWHWRLALVLAAWIIPSVALYTAYYWAPEWNTVAYLRFFVTVFPGLALAALWLVAGPVAQVQTSVAGSASTSHARRLRVSSTLAVGSLVALATGLSLHGTLPHLDNEQRQTLNLLDRASELGAHLPPGSVIFTDDQDLLNHLQFVSDYRLYSGDLFGEPLLKRLAQGDPREPKFIDPQRLKAILDRTRHGNEQALNDERDRIISAALSHGHRVYVIVPNPAMARRFASTDRFQMTIVLSKPDPYPIGLRLLFQRPLAGMLGERKTEPALPEQMPRARWQVYELTPKPR